MSDVVHHRIAAVLLIVGVAVAVRRSRAWAMSQENVETCKRAFVAVSAPSGIPLSRSRAFGPTALAATPIEETIYIVRRWRDDRGQPVTQGINRLPLTHPVG